MASLESFTHIENWLAEVKKYSNENTCMLLVGNKNDRTDKAVETDVGKVSLVMNYPQVCTLDTSWLNGSQF